MRSYELAVGNDRFTLTMLEGVGRESGPSDIEFQYQWQCQKSPRVVRVYNINDKKFFYRRSKDDKTDRTRFQVPPGVYRVDVRFEPDDKPMHEIARQSQIVFGFTDDNKFDIGNAAYLHSETHCDHYGNILSLQDEIDRRETVLASKPLAASIILEGRGCNFKCFYCSHILPGHGYHLDPDNTFTKDTEIIKGEEPFVGYVVGKTNGTSRVLIDSYKALFPYLRTLMFGGSEPTLYPEFREMIEAIGPNDRVQMSVCTNGSLLTESLAERILNTNFPWLRISIDAATEETFRKIRKSELSVVTENIRRLVRMRGKSNKPQIQFNFVCCRSNYHEIVQLVDLAHSLGVRAINYKMLISPPMTWIHSKPFQVEDPLKHEDLCAHILDLMEMAKARASELGVRIVADAISSSIYARFSSLKNNKHQTQQAQSFLTNDEARGVAADGLDDDDGTGPLALAEWAQRADDLVILGQVTRTDESAEPHQVIFTRHGGARIEFEAGPRDSEEAVIRGTTNFREFGIGFPPGSYWIHMRPYFMGRREIRQPKWQSKLLFSVSSSLQDQGYAPVGPITLDSKNEAIPPVVRVYSYRGGVEDKVSARLPRSPDTQDKTDSVVEHMRDLDEDEVLDAPVAPTTKHIPWGNVFCHLPFTNISAGHNRAHFCCWAKDKFHHVAYYGDDITVEDLWNHPVFVEARELMYSGNAQQVCRESCPHLHKGGVKTIGLTDPPPTT